MIICKALRGKGTPLFSYQSPLKRDGLKGCKGGVGGGGVLCLGRAPLVVLALPLGYAG